MIIDIHASSIASLSYSSNSELLMVMVESYEEFHQEIKNGLLFFATYQQYANYVLHPKFYLLEQLNVK